LGLSFDDGLRSPVTFSFTVSVGGGEGATFWLLGANETADALLTVEVVEPLGRVPAADTEDVEGDAVCLTAALLRNVVRLTILLSKSFENFRNASSISCLGFSLLTFSTRKLRKSLITLSGTLGEAG
jgi:hypothetical protein